MNLRPFVSPTQENNSQTTEDKGTTRRTDGTTISYTIVSLTISFQKN